MRMTTHVALTARAFGADAVVLTVNDKKLVDTIKKVCEQFGGEFSISIESKWRNFVLDWKDRGAVVHLTMYGEHIDDALPKISALKGPILIIIGAEKVPRDVYDLADYNVAIGNQPHSEVAALAVLLDRLFKGKGLKQKFNGKMVIEPNPRGKTIRTADGK